MGCVTFGSFCISEPVAVLTVNDKQNISTKQSAYQNAYFILRPYFIQNKHVSYKQLAPHPTQLTNNAHRGTRPTV
jgi:hypothetical protein